MAPKLPRRHLLLFLILPLLVAFPSRPPTIALPSPPSSRRALAGRAPRRPGRHWQSLSCTRVLTTPRTTSSRFSRRASTHSPRASSHWRPASSRAPRTRSASSRPSPSPTAPASRCCRRMTIPCATPSPTRHVVTATSSSCSPAMRTPSRTRTS